MSHDMYWAQRPTNEIGNFLVERVGEYFKFLDKSGRMDLYRKMYEAYYGPALRGSELQFTGDQGELVLIMVNDLRNLLTHLKTLITSQAPAFEVRAVNTDHKSLSQCILGKGIVDYYLREKEVEDYMDEGVELALVYSEAFIDTPWSANKGEVLDIHPDTGAPIRNGDIEFSVYAPYDYVRDFTLRDHRKQTWGIPIDWVNKFELAAEYPDFEETIIGMTDEFRFYEGVENFRDQREFMYGGFESATIPLLTFRHEPTDAIPEGREVKFLLDGTVLYDEALPYRRLPSRRIAAGKWLGSIFGYTTGYDLLPIEEMTNALHSTICSNQNAFGVQNIWTPKGMDMEVEELPGGLKHLQSKEKPETLDLLGTNPEIFKYLDTLKITKETISAINAVARGNPEREMSGAAMALLQTTAIMFSQSLQKSYIRTFEGVGTDILERLKTFAKTPRVAAISGVQKRQYLEEFTADDLALVDRVLVDMGSPITNTAAGRYELAKFYTEQGWIESPNQFVMMATTGTLEPLTEGKQSEMMLIRGENELLMQGQAPPVSIIDNPLTHITEHKVVINSPEARKTPSIMEATQAHIQEHIDLWKGKFDPVTGQFTPGIDPDLAAMLGLPPPPAMGMPPGMTPNPQGVQDQGEGQGPPENSEPPQEGNPNIPGGSVTGNESPNLPEGTPPEVEAAASRQVA